MHKFRCISPKICINDGVKIHRSAIDVAVAAGPDDGFSNSNGAGSFDNAGDAIIVGNSEGSVYQAWYRFTIPAIPAGAIITNARLSLWSFAVVGSNLTTIYADDGLNPAAPANRVDLLGRERTTEGVDWDGIPNVGGYTHSPDISSVIQELIDTYDFTSGGVILILHDDNSSPEDARTVFYSFDHGEPPYLHIEYAEFEETTYIVRAETFLDYSTNPPMARRLVRKSNGDLWCVYLRRIDGIGGIDQVCCAYSVDNGETWTEEQVTTAGAHQYHTAITVDSDDNIHVVWTGKGWGVNTTKFNLQYRKRTDVWQDQEAITDVAYDQYDPSVDVDSSDNVHVVWHGNGWGGNTGNSNLQYRKRTDVWQDQEAITDVAGDQLNNSCAIDSDDNVHVVWRGKGWGGNPTIYNVQYRKRTDSWQAQEAITDIDANQASTSVAIDLSDNVHVVWGGYGWGTNSGNINLQYRKRTDSWQDQEAITDKAADQWFLSVALDSHSYVHIVWVGKGWAANTGENNLRYRKRTDSWQAHTGITDRGYDQDYPCAIYAIHPTIGGILTNVPKEGYALVWTAKVHSPTTEFPDLTNYDMDFYGSDDLAWGTERPRAAPVASSMAAKMVAAGLI